MLIEKASNVEFGDQGPSIIFLTINAKYDEQSGAWILGPGALGPGPGALGLARGAWGLGNMRRSLTTI